MGRPRKVEKLDRLTQGDWRQRSLSIVGYYFLGYLILAIPFIVLVIFIGLIAG